MEKILENIYEAEIIINKLNHMIYMTYPIVNDKKLLLKTLVEAKIAIVKCINFILQYDFLFNKITLKKNPKDNFKTFSQICAPRYNITLEEVTLISTLFDIVERHKNSSFEFRKGEKLVILNEGSEPAVINQENAKKYVLLAREILKKTKQILRKV
ncbi:MAG TPA: hypothetical protein VJ438_04030 [Candidatus Nanoarchaeia archaeon]|nr:hypothetical protein [Candidatus Nanoarchaeia archaeon]